VGKNKDYLNKTSLKIKRW